MFGSRKRVAITGIGIISCLGLGAEEVRTALREGKSGIRLLPERKEMGFRSGLSGVVQGFDCKAMLGRKWRKTLPEFGQWAFSAVSQALDQARISVDELSGDEATGMIFGNDSSAVTAVEQVDALRKNGETRAIGSGHIFRLMNSTVTLNLSSLFKLRGPSWTVSAACASGAVAIGQGADLISRGIVRRMICGGAQEISWQSMCSFDALGAFSVREDVPEAASRPFDAGRDGLVPSGGAAAVVLEEFESAEKRDAPILGEVVGYGHTSDGYHIAVPSGEGLDRAMRQALQNASVSPEKIDLVMAHATSTQAGDRAEAVGLRRVFRLDEGARGPLVTAVKGLTGHEFWMAGAAQVVYGLIMARNGFVAGNPNLEEKDPDAAPLHIPRRSVETRVKYMLCNSAGFGGTNGCLVIRVV